MLEFKGVTKRFGEKAALEDVSLTLPGGQTHVLIGSSGSGKTTLLRILLGLERPDRGAVALDGTQLDLARQREWVRHIGYVPQSGGLFPHLTAAQNVTLVARTLGWERARIEARLEELRELVGLEPATLGRYAKELSGGQQQRVALMRAAFLDPRMMVLDEPLGALDPLLRSDLQAQLKDIFNRMKKMVLLVTHDLGEAAFFGHTVTLLHRARVEQTGTIEDLAQRPASAFVTRFLSAQARPVLSALLLCLFTFRAFAADVTVGSKAFTEGFVMGEYAAQVLESEPRTEVVRKFGLGGTGIVFEALRAGQIDVYPEYTGTIAQTVLNRNEPLDVDQINAALAEQGLVISRPLGFRNGYAIATTRKFAEANGLRTIGDLARVADRARVAFSTEFLARPDGYPRLRDKYGFGFGRTVRSLEHSLAFEALRNDEADVTDVYTTDAKIEKLDLVLLVDDRDFSIPYEAVWMSTKAFTSRRPDLWRALRQVEGRLDEKQMRHLNGLVDLERRPVASVVREALGAKTDTRSVRQTQLRQRTHEHAVLVGLALAFSIVCGVPLGILAAYRRRLGQAILLFSSVVQTIPSLALLCFLIPLFGIGVKPALVALCFYGLLPVVLNTYIGLSTIDPALRDTCKALGLSFWTRLWRVELPLASPNILAGVKTSAIVGIGTATLAALIGAGGYGAPIVTGLAVNDMSVILSGAIPAALMAIFAYAVFALLEFLVVPKGLRAQDEIEF